MKVNDVKEYVLKLKGAANLNPDEGVLYGDPEAEVKGMLVTWMASVKALEASRRQGCNLVVCHEGFYLYWSRDGMTPQHPTWAPNRRRLEAAAAGGITVMRLHGTLDVICIYDDFAEALGLENPTRGTGYRKVFPIPETTVGELVKRVKKALGMKLVRVAGDLKKKVRCVGLPWGGLGLDSNIAYQQGCIEMGADVFIAGETDEYGMHFAQDAGVPIIETGHSISENIGMKHFARMLREEFPGTKVAFYSKTRIFDYV